MEFSLIKELTGLSPFQWLLFAVCVALFVVSVVFLARRQQKQGSSTSVKKGIDINALVYGALCIALSFILSYIHLFRLPQAGSVTLASMLPVMLYAYWYGPRRGFVVAFAYSILQFIQDPYFLSFAQFMLDYILGFTVLGLTSLFRKHLFSGIAISGALRLFCSFLSGVIFFAEYAPEGMNPALYSILYQLATIGVDTLICLVVAFVMMQMHVIERLRPRHLTPSSI